MKVRLHPQAEAELQDAAQWYEKRKAGLGEQFIDESYDALIDIEQYPTRFARPPYRTSRRIRRRMLEHFPYGVVYELRKTECIVVAAAHAARRPKYWQNRLESI